MRGRLANAIFWLLVACNCLLSMRAAAETTATYPYRGVTHIYRTDSTPRPVMSAAPDS